MLKKLKTFFIIFISFFILTCKTTEETVLDFPTMEKEEVPKKVAFEIGKLTWVIDQIEPTFWAKGAKVQNRMFISFALEYTGQFDLETVQSLVIDAPGDYYIIEGEDLKKVLEVEKSSINCKRLPCGKGEGRVGLGEWLISLTLKDGTKIVKNPQITGFYGAEDINVNGKAKTTYIAPKAKFKNEISALDVPKIKSVSRDEDSIEIYFSVSDSRIKNGYFWFDVPGEKEYRDAGSMLDGTGKPVNGCRKFSADGSQCRFILRKDDDNAEWFDKAVACCFVVSDVNRVTDPWNERIRSISSLIKIE